MSLEPIHLSLDEYAGMVVPVDPNAHKFSKGSLLVAGGCQRYTGAPMLCALAGARAGAGYVTLAVPDCIADIAKSHLLTIPVISSMSADGMFAHGTYSEMVSQVNRIGAIALGPGMGVSPSAAEFVADVLENTQAPVVVDADAINVLSSHCADDAKESCSRALDAFMKRGEAGLQTILTPHAGELSRLYGALCKRGILPEANESDSRLEKAEAIARATGAVVVAKGPVTYIASNGKTIASDFADASLATAGTGDVLCGIIASLCAQGMAAPDAASLGVCIHSLAGVCAGEKLGMRSVIATDVIDMIPAAYQRLQSH